MNKIVTCVCDHIRIPVLISVVLGLVLLVIAFTSDHLLAEGWRMQVVMDVGLTLVRLFIFYISIRLFTHLRTHQVIQAAGKGSTMHIAFAIGIMLSCAYIIGSVS